MQFIFACFLLGFACGRPPGNYEGDSSLDHAAYNEDMQRRRHLQQSPARQHPLIDYGGNTFQQQRGHTQRVEQSEPEEEVDAQCYQENYGELRAKSKDHVNRLASPNDHKSSNARNSRQDKFIRDAKAKASKSPPSEGLQKRTTSEAGQRINYGVASNLNDYSNDNQRTLSEETNENLNYAADYEAEEASENDPGIDEERVHQKQINTVDIDSEPGEYDDDNQGNEELRKRRDTSSRIIETEVTQSKPEQSTTQTTNAGGNENGESVEAKEELAIKRHIADLSDIQINELLTSLPSDKRVLLQEIIDSDKVETKKREVGKSDGTIRSEDERENPNSSMQPAAVKLPDSTVNQLSKSTETDILSKASDPIINIKETLSNNEAINNIKDPQSISQVGDNNSAGINDDNVSDVGLKETVQTESYAKADVQRNVLAKAAVEKINKKREINLNDYDSAVDETEDNSDMNAESRDETNDNDYSVACSIEEPSNSETLKSKSEIQPMKREVYDEKLSKQRAIKSDLHHKELTIAEQIEALEASFPNVRSYDDNIDKEQLVRVKRNKRDLQRKKRAAAVSAHETNSPYRADTEDEDDDEGNEFDGDGFYDRTSNLGGERQAKFNKVIPGKDTSRKRVDSEAAEIVSEHQSKLVPTAQENSFYQDMSGIGSDSDNVLSGSDGVDENLMLNGVRSRLSRDSDKDLNCIGEVYDSSEAVDKKLATEELQSVQNDHNGAFGGLPKSYDGELSRFKRIRRRE